MYTGAYHAKDKTKDYKEAQKSYKKESY